MTQTIALSQPGHTAVVRATGTGHFLIARDLWLPCFGSSGCHRQLSTIPLGPAGTPKAGTARPPAPLRVPPNLPSLPRGFPALSAPAAGFLQPYPGCQRGTARSLRPHLGGSGFLPSFLPFPGAGRAAREPPRCLPQRRGRAAAPSRCLLPRRRGTATGNPRPVPFPRGAALTTTCAPGSLRDLGLISGDTM